MYLTRLLYIKQINLVCWFISNFKLNLEPFELGGIVSPLPQFISILNL